MSCDEGTIGDSGPEVKEGMMCEMKVMAVGERSMETVGIKWTGPEAVIVNSAAVIAAVNGAAVSVAAGSVVADQ